MTTSTNSLSPEIIAQLAELQALRAEKAAAEAEAKAAEERKRIAAENGGFAPGIHPFGFQCLLDVNGDPSSPYVKFRVTIPTVVLREPQESADGKTVYGPELLILPPGVVLSWSAGGPKTPMATGAYVRASGGSSSSTISYSPADWMTHSQIGVLVRYVVNGSSCTESAWFIDDLQLLNSSSWLAEVEQLMIQWCKTLTPAGSKRKTPAGSAGERKARR